ncbi:hypothetical protein [Mycolicibacterium elephantis]|uniref:Uncharacterized protein n=1 Tax=Mycolicibacterium elephantis DSM 44368 TaxID=1335622 RepID=A0A439DXY1_9MYCO|nr:hypothetical protein [Mycolicibacterium elephantis]MCV7223637.1 hypothetical protein [Mycolicibacterium elephantis]RWA22344.1 hypothetical protein MELE44368_13100 [Mycolicibacterium elephantis DSM 44368]
MTIAARNNTPAAGAGQRPQPAPVHSQDEQRRRRRVYLPNHYTGTFDVAAEVAAICEPLARRVADLPRPGACWREVDALVAAAHELAHVAVGLIAERDARRKTAHLSYDKRGRSVRALVDLAERPALPEIGDHALASGDWPATLVALVQPHTAPLSDVLAQAMPPGSTRGTRTASERVEAALRVLDAAALSLDRLLDRADRSRAERSRPAPMTDTDKARAELAALGIDA